MRDQIEEEKKDRRELQNYCKEAFELSFSELQALLEGVQIKPALTLVDLYKERKIEEL